jgi:hypothetical protein
MSHARITPDMWPDLKPGQVKATKIDSDEALFSVGRRRGTKHVVLSESEALASIAELTWAFGFTPAQVRSAKLASAKATSIKMSA